jgi:hypothetical protein
MHTYPLLQLTPVFLLLFAINVFPQSQPAQLPQSKYHCPMCDGVQSDNPGNCPNCGMKLLPRSEAKKKIPAYSLSKRVSFPKQTVEGFDVAVLLKPLSKPDSNATHTVEITIINHKTGKHVTDADCWFHITYPDGRNLMPHLQRAQRGYTGAIDLRRHGTYSFMAHVNMEDNNVTRVIEARLR